MLPASVILYQSVIFGVCCATVQGVTQAAIGTAQQCYADRVGKIWQKAVKEEVEKNSEPVELYSFTVTTTTEFKIEEQ